MNDNIMKCVFCGQNTFQRIITFSSVTIKKCKRVLEYRRNKSFVRKSRTTYNNVELPAETSLNEGYHAQCYKWFTAIKIPSDFQKIEQQQSESAAECDNAPAISGKSSKSFVPATSTTTQADGTLTVE